MFQQLHHRWEITSVTWRMSREELSLFTESAVWVVGFLYRCFHSHLDALGVLYVYIYILSSPSKKLKSKWICALCLWVLFAKRERKMMSATREKVKKSKLITSVCCLRRFKLSTQWAAISTICDDQSIGNVIKTIFTKFYFYT